MNTCQKPPMIDSAAMYEKMMAGETELCGKPAHFKSSHGMWYCAEHWDEFRRDMAEISAAFKQFREAQ